jgi:hypothetical protein
VDEVGEFERALAQTESDAFDTQRAAEAVVKASKQLVAAARAGDVAALEKALAETKRTTSALTVQQRNAQEGWDFDAIGHVRDGGYLEELKDAAEALGLRLFEQEGRLFSYPVLLRIIGGSTTADLAVTIDRKRTRAIRPSFLAGVLNRASTQAPKFKPDVFLKALYEAYRVAEGEYGRRAVDARTGPMVELVRLYELLTLFPGQQKEYGRQEFARDLYFLDQGTVKETNSHTFRLAASTGTKGSASKLFQLVDRDGRERVYYAISFERVP